MTKRATTIPPLIRNVAPNDATVASMMPRMPIVSAQLMQSQRLSAIASALHADIVALIGRFNRSGDGTMVVPSEYLEVVVTKR